MMRDSADVMDEFLMKLEKGEFKKQQLQNPPPYFYGTKEEVDNKVNNYKDFLNSDTFKMLNMHL